MASVTHYEISADGTASVVNSSGVNGRATPLVLLQSAWSGEGPYSLTLAVGGVTSDTTACHVIISPAPGSLSEYGTCGIYVTAQTEGALAFSADALPENDLIVHILIITPNGYVSDAENPDAGYLRYDEIQTLTETQQQNVVDALGLEDGFLRYDEPQALTETQQQNVVDALGLEDRFAAAGTTSGVTMKLLWTNASPGSQFGAQTVGLSKTGYDILRIVFNYSASKQSAQAIVDLQNTTSKQGCGLCGMADNGFYFGARPVSVSSSGLTFSAAIGMSSNSDKTTNNYMAIPARIYGIKGVS